MNFYISDLHLGHLNVMTKHENRPFKTLEEQDERIISNINKIVTPQDNLYFLGDISWYKPDKTAELLKQINCKNLFLVKGNHDHWIKDATCKKLFQGIYDYKVIQDKDKTVVMSHYPILFYQSQHRESVHLYGHVHNTREEKLFQNACKNIADTTDIPMNCYNVGCMMSYIDYIPRTLEEIINSNKKK